MIVLLLEGSIKLLYKLKIDSVLSSKNVDFKITR